MCMKRKIDQRIVILGPFTDDTVLARDETISLYHRNLI